MSGPQPAYRVFEAHSPHAPEEVVASDPNRSTVEVRLQGLATFTGLRGLANIEWVGGILAGTMMAENSGGSIVRQVVAPTVVAASVTGMEYLQSSLALKHFQRQASNDQTHATDRPKHPVSNSQMKTILAPYWLGARMYGKEISGKIPPPITKEVGGLAVASWQGAGATVEYNNAVGLASNPKRRLAQSAVYGAAIGLWSSPVPPWKQARHSAYNYLTDFWHSPIADKVIGTGKALAASGLAFGALQVVKKARRVSAVAQNNPEQDQS